jgi:hypothetical protein
MVVEQIFDSLFGDFGDASLKFCSLGTFFCFDAGERGTVLGCEVRVQLVALLCCKGNQVLHGLFALGIASAGEVLALTFDGLLGFSECVALVLQRRDRGKEGSDNVGEWVGI